MPDASISIIVPCWGADAIPPGATARWLASGVVREVIVAAAPGENEFGGHSRESAEGMRVHRCARVGRGVQMNEGAARANGDVLLFHHADTELDERHLRALDQAMRQNPSLGGGAFVRQFDERHPRLRWLEPWEARRCRWFGPLFGDQSIFARRRVFEELGGYADLPLMEDVEFSRKLRRRYPIALLEPPICSSARKHLQQGRWQTTLGNAAFLLGYLAGIPPRRLHGWYYRRLAPSSVAAREKLPR